MPETVKHIGPYGIYEPQLLQAVTVSPILETIDEFGMAGIALTGVLKLPATVFTYTFGIITALVAGVGMCLSMKVIGSGSTTMFVLGVIVGIIGLLGMGVNYPIYKKLLAQGKQKYAFEIMELAKEISEM